MQNTKDSANGAHSNSDKMNNPSYKLLVTAPMAAIMSSGKAMAEWSGLLASVGPIYHSAAGDTQGEVSEALSTVSFILQGGDSFISKYFEKDDLSFSKMMDVSATGADVWMCKVSDGEIEKADATKLFQTIQAGLVKTVGDVRDSNEMVDQLIQVQDKVVEHISSLD